MNWVKAKDKVPTITKYYVVRQNNWATTWYCDSKNSLKILCECEPMLFLEDIEWLNEENDE